jgi:hypothetical protein
LRIGRCKDEHGQTKDDKDNRDGKEGRLFPIPSSRNLLAPEGVQAAEEFFQAREGCGDEVCVVEFEPVSPREAKRSSGVVKPCNSS